MPHVFFCGGGEGPRIPSLGCLQVSEKATGCLLWLCEGYCNRIVTGLLGTSLLYSILHNDGKNN